jgi:hypothetical protein
MGRLDVRQVQEKTLEEAKKQAAALRDMYGKLSKIERSLGAKYLEPILTLVTAVEAL